VSGDSTITTAVSTNATSSTPRLAIKGFRQKIGKAITSKDSKGSHGNSPKSTRKEIEHSGSTGTGPAKGISSSSRAQADGKKSSTSSTDPQEKNFGKIHGARITSEGSSESHCSGSSSQGPSSNPGGQSILRHPKSSSATGNGSARDNRNRFSSTGIPTRNSLIVSNNSISRDELHQSSHGLAYDSSSVHSSMSSINGLANQPGNGTGIPKPTAAVKGTTKLQSVKDEKSNGSSGLKVGVKEVTSKNMVSSKTSPASPPYGNGSSNSKNDRSSVVQDPVSAKVTASSVKLDALSRNRNGSEDTQRRIENLDNESKAPVENDTLNESTTSKSSSKVVESGVTVAMIAPMPSITNSVSNSASASSVESSSHSLSHSQLSSLSQSNSNSSEVSVIHVKGPHQSTLQESQLARENTLDQSVVRMHSSERVGNSSKLEVEGQKNITQSNVDSSKVSPMSAYGTGSGSSSMGSLQCGPDSSSGASSSGECDGGSSRDLEHPPPNSNGTNISPSHNGNDAIPECDEDELLLSVTPMEPLSYQYMKSPPSGHHTPGFLSPKSGSNGTNCIPMARIGREKNRTNWIT
jgi:hypothetical protein